MTTRDRKLSAARGAALALCLSLSRSGALLDASDAIALYRAVSGLTGGILLTERVWTPGGSTVDFVPRFGCFAVRVAASPI